MAVHSIHTYTTAEHLGDGATDADVAAYIAAERQALAEAFPRASITTSATSGFREIVADTPEEETDVDAVCIGVWNRFVRGEIQPA
jgi:hypothetical protein